ncbi:MAG: arylamine N-acetyltransferase [Melioribacteraceae bacterium]|nr:arylamine N-acetyltransferase [Melioribacteraceae bacterium]
MRYSGVYKKYLSHLGVNFSRPDYDNLLKLIRSQIQKFPFENVFKIINYYGSNLTTLTDIELHLENSIIHHSGGTCFANNYYFKCLLDYLDYRTKFVGCNIAGSADAHAALIVSVDEKNYFVDVGYGAPFYEPFQLDRNVDKILVWGRLKYIFTHNANSLPVLKVYKNEVLVHDYVVNPIGRDISYFQDEISKTFLTSSYFMNLLRIIKFSNQSWIELKNNVVYEHYRNSSVKTIIENEYLLKKVIATKFEMSWLPVLNTVELLSEHKGINIFKDNN